MERDVTGPTVHIAYQVGLQFPHKLNNRFGECYICFGCETKTRVYVFRLFFKVGLCSAISFERSRRELIPLIWLNIGLCWKFSKIRTTPVLLSHPEQVKHSPKRVFCFYCARFFLMGFTRQPCAITLTFAEQWSPEINARITWSFRNQEVTARANLSVSETFGPRCTLMTLRCTSQLVSVPVITMAASPTLNT